MQIDIQKKQEVTGERLKFCVFSSHKTRFDMVYKDYNLVDKVEMEMCSRICELLGEHPLKESANKINRGFEFSVNQTLLQQPKEQALRDL